MVKFTYSSNYHSIDNVSINYKKLSMFPVMMKMPLIKKKKKKTKTKKKLRKMYIRIEGGQI
jgi:hypothetical protein